MQESMVQLRSDSECSYASSYSDASEEEEDLNQFVDENKTNILHGGQALALANNENKDEDSIEEDLNNYQDLTEQIKVIELRVHARVLTTVTAQRSGRGR